MRKPKMILFDYGQTLANEKAFDGIAGTKAVLQYATKNKYNHTAEDVQAAADAINAELGRFDPKQRHLVQIEVPNHMFTAFLYQSMGIELPLSYQDIDRAFWNAASPGVPTDGIEDFLAFLKEQNIRTGVISNITYCGEVVEEEVPAEEEIPAEEPAAEEAVEEEVPVEDEEVEEVIIEAHEPVAEEADFA